MEHSILMTSNPLDGGEKLEELQQSLELIDQKLEQEILSKQKTIERQEQEIQRLHALIEGKDKIIMEIHEKLTDCNNSSEGNRQLINKLVSEIELQQQNIEWYKKTYETRSVLGMLREKLVRKIPHAE